MEVCGNTRKKNPDPFLFCLSVFTQVPDKRQEYETDALWDPEITQKLQIVWCQQHIQHTTQRRRFCWFEDITWGLRHGWHPLTNTGESHFLYKVWFMSTVCHYERNVSVSGHHTYVEQHTDHSAYLPGRNLKLSVMGNLYNVSWGVKGHLVACYLSRTRCWERGREEHNEWE